MLRIAELLQSYGKKVIFATTTPTHPNCPHHKLERIQRYNETVVPALRERGVRINDLFSVMLEHQIDDICEDQLHLSELGIELCTAQTVCAIRNALGEDAQKQS